jgi:hypothetical protein
MNVGPSFSRSFARASGSSSGPSVSEVSPTFPPYFSSSDATAA